MDIDHLQSGFTYVVLERINPEKNENRFYYLAWQPSLFEEGAVVRAYGRKNGQRRTLTPVPYSSLDEAWPMIRTILRRRLQHGYTIAAPKVLVGE